MAKKDVDDGLCCACWGSRVSSDRLELCTHCDGTGNEPSEPKPAKPAKRAKAGAK